MSSTTQIWTSKIAYKIINYIDDSNYANLMKGLYSNIKISDKEYLQNANELLRTNKYINICAFDGEKLIGNSAIYIQEKPADNVAYIEDVVVDPAYRKLGVGANLVRKCIDWIEANNRSALENSTNTRIYKVNLTCKDELIGWYEKFGFCKGNAMTLRF